MLGVIWVYSFGRLWFVFVFVHCSAVLAQGCDPPGLAQGQLVAVAGGSYRRALPAILGTRGR